MAYEKEGSNDLQPGEHHFENATFAERRKLSTVEIQDAVRSGSVPTVRNRSEAIAIAAAGGWEADALCEQLQKEVDDNGGEKKGMFDLNFKNPRHFTFLLVAFASMGGLLSGLDQSLISGANLFLPLDLGLTPQQNSLVNSGMPLGAIGGALIHISALLIIGRTSR